MSKGKLAFVKKWGILRFGYAYTMLMLNRFLGFRLSAIRAKHIDSDKYERFEKNGIVYRTLSAFDFNVMELNQSLDISHTFIEKAFARGDQCVGALDGKKVVGYAWRSSSQVEVDYPIYMQFGNKLYYRYKGFVAPEYRGKDIFNNIKLVAESAQIGLDRTYAFGCIETHNYPSLKASHKHGDISIGYTAYISNRFFFLSWSSKKAKHWGIRTFKKAEES